MKTIHLINGDEIRTTFIFDQYETTDGIYVNAEFKSRHDNTKHYDIPCRNILYIEDD